MLTQIRARASGWLAWVIVILISIPFALWGIQSYFENAAEAAVATVNGEEISLYAYQNELSRRRQAQRNVEVAELRAEVAEAMVGERLLRQYVNERNYRVSDAALKERIQSNAAFLTDGEFDPELYQDLLRANGYTAQSFELQERQSAAIAQLSAAVADSAFVTAAEMERLAGLQNQLRAAEYAIVPASRFAAAINIAAAAVQKHYAENADAYRTEARMQADYLELSVAKLAAQITPTEDEILANYEATLERYKQAETRKASHILFASDADDADTDAAAREQAEKVLAQANAGADFAELAKKHSADPGSKDRGGDLGVVTRGQMVPPFEEAVFAMRAGEIRGPVKTQFGYHIIKLTELQPARQKSLDESRAEVVAEIKRARAENRFAELGETFENLVFEEPDSLAAAADELGIAVERTDWFTASEGAGLAGEEKIRQAAFSDEVLHENLNSAAIALGFERLAAIRKAEYEPARAQTLDEVRARIREELTRAQTAEQAKQLSERLVAELQNAAPTGDNQKWHALLKRENLQSQTLPERRAAAPPNLTALATAVFTESPPADGATAYNGVQLDNGDYAVFALTAVKKAEADDETQRAQLRRQLLARDGGDFYQQLRDTIRASAEVTIYQEQLENQRREF